MKEWGVERCEIRTFPSIIWVSHFPSFIPELGKEEVPKHYRDSTNNKLHISSGEGFWPCSQGCMTEDSNLVGLLTLCSSNWLTSCVIRAGLLWLEIPQSLSQQRLLEDVILAKVLQMVFSKVFFCWFVFYLKKFLAVPQGLWDLSSPTSDRTLASCVVSCESGILRVHFLLVKIISIGTYLITSSSEITVSIFCWGSASKASKPRTAPSLNSTKGSVPCIECILYTSADN